MQVQTKRAVHQFGSWLLLFVLFSTGLLFVAPLQTRERGAFVSSEIAFTDPSQNGLQIMPASCSSNPSYYHRNLPATSDGLGYISNTGTTEYGAYRNSVYICATNTTGASLFVPANTAAEMNAMKTNVGSGGTYFRVW